jgi:hypothetical protein
MAASEGVDLEWAIVELARGDKLSRTYSPKILDQAKKAVAKLNSKVTKPYKIYHSDELKISAKPEPKTDIVVKKGSKQYNISVKMEGGIQLASGQGASTAELFRSVATHITDQKQKKVLNDIISSLNGLPTRLLSESNFQRILQSGNKKLIEEFIKGKKIKEEKSYEEWLQNKKPEMIASLMDFVKKNPQFKTALILEALSGKNTLKDYKDAAANYVLSPAGFYQIDESYARNLAPKIKMDIRAKSRSGITSIAFRIETRGSI